MRIHCLLPFHRKLKSVCRPARLLLFLRDKFVVRRQTKRFRKNRNCSLAQESIHLAAVTLTVDGCVNNIKFASYLTGNRPLTCKRIKKRQRPSDTRTPFNDRLPFNLLSGLPGVLPCAMYSYSVVERLLSLL